MKTLVLAKVVLWRDDHKILIMKRALDMPYRPGEFDIPGGKIEPGEDLIDGAIREVQEETGIRLEADHLELVFADSGLRLDVPAAWLFFMAKVSDPNVTASSEHTEYDWMELERAITVMEDNRQKRLLQFMRENNSIK